MNAQKTQIAHAIFQQEDLDAAILTYRERVREDDTPELKALLRKQALDAHCPLTHENLERAKSVLGQLILADTEKMFEPETEPEPEPDEADAEPEPDEAEADLEPVETEDDVKANLKALVLDMLSNGAMTVENLSLKADVIEESIRWALKQLTLDGKVETTDGETYSLCVATETSEPETETDEGDEPVISPNAQRVLDVMPDKYWTLAELNDHLGITPDRIYAALDELRDAGKVEPIGDNQYRVVLSDEEYEKLCAELSDERLSDEILAIFENVGGAFSTFEISKRCRVDEARVNKLFGALAEAGKIKSINDDQFVLATETSEPETSELETERREILETQVLAEVEKGDNFHCQSISDAVNAPIGDVLTALEQLIIAGKIQLVGESSFKLVKKSLFGVKIHRDDIQKTLSELEKADAPVSVMELSKRLNTNSAKIAHAIGQLIADGRAITVGYNQYKLGDVDTFANAYDDKPLEDIPIVQRVLDVLSDSKPRGIQALMADCDASFGLVDYALLRLIDAGKVVMHGDPKTYSLPICDTDEGTSTDAS